MDDKKILEKLNDVKELSNKLYNALKELTGILSASEHDGALIEMGCALCKWEDMDLCLVRALDEVHREIIKNLVRDSVSEEFLELKDRRDGQ